MGTRVRVGTNGVSASTSVSGQGCGAVIGVLFLAGIIAAVVETIAHYWIWFVVGAGVIVMLVALAVMSNRKKAATRES